MKPIKDWPYRGARIGRGWHPDGQTDDEFHDLVTQMMQAKLNEIFEIARNEAETRRKLHG